MARTPWQQRGIVAVLVAIGLLALVAIAGLAIDTGHLVLNKSRLQSTVDAAALAAAKVLDQTGSQTQATSAADAVFALNAAELSGVVSSPSITVQYSNTLNPFADGSTPANYVRVRAENFSMWTSLTRVVGFDELSTAASAVAGPSAPILPTGVCDVVPLMVCAGMPGGTKANQWGGVLDPSEVKPLKVAVADSFAKGNSGLVCLEEDRNCGGSDIERWLKSGACIPPGGRLNTKPGTGTGPTSKGLSTRFDTTGLPKYPPDTVTAQVNPLQLTMQPKDQTNVFFCANGTPDKCKTIGPRVTSVDGVHVNYADYKARLKSGPYDQPTSGVAGRRVVALPVVDCREAEHGREEVQILDFACFFLLQEVINVSSNPAFVLGQYTNEPCNASGTPGSTPGSETGSGVYKIVLHNDPNSADS